VRRWCEKDAERYEKDAEEMQKRCERGAEEKIVQK